MTEESLALKPAVKYTWILGTVWDVVFLLGPALSAILVYALFSVKDNWLEAATLTVAPIYAMNVFHQGATWFHYVDKENRDYWASEPTKRRNFLFMPWLILAISLAMSQTIPWLLIVVYLVWSIQHLAQQNVGILLLYHNQGTGEAIVPRNLEVRSQQAAAAFFAFVAMARIGDNLHATWTFWGPFVAIFGIWTLHLTVCYLHNMFVQLRQGAHLNVPALAFWVSSMLFFLPLAFIGSNIFHALVIPSVMHWWQYIGLNYILVKRKYATERIANLPWQQPTMLFLVFCTLIVIAQYGSISACYLYFLHNDWQKHLLIGLIFGLGMIHYFLDGCIWKFRENFSRQTILPYLLQRK